MDEHRQKLQQLFPKKRNDFFYIKAVIQLTLFTAETR